MAPRVEVLAVELKQFRGEGLRTLVPRVVAGTGGARSRASGPRARRTRETLLAEFPEGPIRGSAQKLLERAQDAGARFEFGSSGVSIRTRSPAWPGSLVTVAWLFPPGSGAGWMRARDFSFGASTLEEYDPPPPADLREALRRYTASFQSDSWARDASSKGVTAYWVAPEEAAEHVETLCARVEAVLGELAALPPAE